MKIPTNWTFKTKEVASSFDSHVREQLPWYDLATGIVVNVARQFIPEGGSVADVGASTGNISRAIAPIVQHRSATLTAIEPSREMAAQYDGPGDLVVRRAQDIESWDHDLIICFLVLMFIPLRDRRALISRMIDGLRFGGALVVFDKLNPRAGQIGALSLRLTLAAKYEAGAKPDEIIAKELSLSGAQRPLYPAEISELDPIFRFGDFGGWLFVKDWVRGMPAPAP